MHQLGAADCWPRAGRFWEVAFLKRPSPTTVEITFNVQMIENWVYSLFFCAGELWGGVVISVLFWSLANEVCSVSDAKTIYPSMGIAANVALVVAGNYMKWVNNTLTQAGCPSYL